MLRKYIVKLVTNIDCKKMIVKNPEINQNTVLAKNIILDICAVDETGRVIDIEMQMAGNNNSESARFQFYGARLLIEQLDAGEKYNMLRPVYQIIFINDDDDCLISGIIIVLSIYYITKIICYIIITLNQHKLKQRFY